MGCLPIRPPNRGGGEGNDATRRARTHVPTAQRIAQKAVYFRSDGLKYSF